MADDLVDRDRRARVRALNGSRIDWRWAGERFVDYRTPRVDGICGDRVWGFDPDPERAQGYRWWARASRDRA